MSQHLYHVTFLHRLDLIRDRGIYPKNRNTNLGVPYRGTMRERSGSIYTTGYRSVPYWMKKISDIHPYDPNYPEVKEGVPVAVRIDVEGLDTIIKDHVYPHRIQVWNGSRWIPIRELRGKRYESFSEMAESVRGVDPISTPLRPMRLAAKVASRWLDEQGNTLESLWTMLPEHLSEV